MMPPSTPSLGSLTSATTSSSQPDRKPNRFSSLPTTRWSISGDLARLVRSSSTASSTTSRSQPRSPDWNVSSTASNDLTDDDNDQDRTIHHIDTLGHDVRLELQMTRSPGDNAPERSRKAKIYDFLSRSTSRSRSQSASRPSNASSHLDPDSTASPAPTPNVDLNLTPTRHGRERGAKPATRSPSRPLSNTTSGTVSTITPANAPARGHTPRAHVPLQSTIPEYDPRMPPPPVPPPKKKSRASTLFGITIPGRSRPPTPKGDPPNITSPPLSPVRGRSGWDSPVTSGKRHGKDPPPKVEWLQHAGPSSNFVVAPQPRNALPIQPVLVGRTPVDNTTDPIPRTHSSPPKLSNGRDPTSEYVRPSSSVSSRSRDGRCSPLFGLRLFGGGAPGSRGHSVSRSSSRKGKERATEKEKPVVSVPMLRTRTRSKDGPPPSPIVPASSMAPSTRKARHGSFDFERINSAATSAGMAGIGAGNTLVTDVKRSASQNRAERHVRSTHHTHPHAPPQSGSGHVRVDHHSSRRRVSPAYTPQDPPPSAHSQSTATTNTTPGTNAAGTAYNNGGSWGRKTRTAGWVRAGVHPPFAFESATSGSGASNGRASPANTSDGRGKASFDSRRERERVTTEREHERSRSRGEGRWEARDVELGLGLTWAPSKIKVREWRATEKDKEHNRERYLREGEREARERLQEFGYVGAGGGYSATTGARRKHDREVTGRYRNVLGEAGFEAFKKYVRRFDAEIIPLEGSAGLLMRVRRLLDTAPSPGVNEHEKREMLDDLVRIIRETET